MMDVVETVTAFRKPVFGKGIVELRCDNDEVCIYGTKEGLQKVVGLITRLLDNPSEGHIHLQDYELLTDESLIGAVAVFDDEC
jgi:hypothetical protein